MPLLSFIKNAQNQTDVKGAAGAAFPAQEQRRSAYQPVWHRAFSPLSNTRGRHQASYPQSAE
jgi:hypothetical protein